MKTPEPDTPGARLRAARLAKGWSQMKLAQLVGYSREHITYMELNRYRGGVDAWRNLADTLGVPVGALLDKDEVPGFAEVATILAPDAMPTGASADDELADIAAQVQAMLEQERGPTDARTVTKMAAEIWREARRIGGPLPLDERAAIILSERRSRVQAARRALFHS